MAVVHTAKKTNPLSTWGQMVSLSWKQADILLMLHDAGDGGLTMAQIVDGLAEIIAYDERTGGAFYSKPIYGNSYKSCRRLWARDLIEYEWSPLRYFLSDRGEEAVAALEGLLS
jgi:hypothetical protein